MKRVKIKFGFASLSTKKLLERFMQVVPAMKGNKHFPEQQDLVNKVTETGNELTSVYGEVIAGNKRLISRRDVLHLALVNQMTLLGETVTVVSDGNLEMLSSTGYELFKQRTPVGSITAPKGLTLADGKKGGLTAKILKERAAAGYVFQWTTNLIAETTVWESARVSYVKHTITQLESGKRYWVRVGAVDRMGDVLFCDPVSRVAQ